MLDGWVDGVFALGRGNEFGVDAVASGGGVRRVQGR